MWTELFIFTVDTTEKLTDSNMATPLAPMFPLGVTPSPPIRPAHRSLRRKNYVSSHILYTCIFTKAHTKDGWLDVWPENVSIQVGHDQHVKLGGILNHLEVQYQTHQNNHTRVSNSFFNSITSIHSKSLVLFGSIRSGFYQFGSIWFNLVQSDSFWFNLVRSVSVWFNPVRFNLLQSISVWFSLIQSGSIRFNLDQSVLDHLSEYSHWGRLCPGTSRWTWYLCSSQQPPDTFWETGHLTFAWSDRKSYWSSRGHCHTESYLPLTEGKQTVSSTEQQCHHAAVTRFPLQIRPMMSLDVILWHHGHSTVTFNWNSAVSEETAPFHPDAALKCHSHGEIRLCVCAE